PVYSQHIILRSSYLQSSPPPSSTIFPYTTLFRSSGLERIGRFESGSSCRNADQYHGDAAQSAARSSIGIQEPGRQRSNGIRDMRSEEHTSGLQSRSEFVCGRLLD